MADKEPCLIGSKITIRGQVSGNQDLIVEGRIEGRVSLENRLTVEESGTIEADLEVVDATFKGEVRGEITGEEPLTILGTVKGKIAVAQNLLVEQGATVEANVEAQTLTVGGRLTGNVLARERVELRSDAKVIGDVKAPRIVIADGASF